MFGYFPNESYMKPVEEAHKAVGTGRFSSCDKKVAEGCRTCCHHGSTLFPGEELKVIPAGVQVTKTRITNCLGDQGCKFPDRDKPLICKAFPVLVPTLDDAGSQEIIRAKKDMNLCPAIVPKRLRDRITEAVAILAKAGLWKDGRVKLDRLEREEVQAIKDSRSILRVQ